MELLLYKTTDNENVINKNKTLITTKEIKLKSNDNIFNPDLLLKNDFDIETVNYAKLLNKFYFVNTERYRNNKYIILHLYEDTIETYKNDILNSKFDIIEKSTANNIGTMPVSEETENINYYSNVSLPETNTVVLQTIGNTFNNEV